MDQPRNGWRLEPASSRDELHRQCRQAIEGGLVAGGERLPNEREMAELSGLSRSTVRIVLAQLEHDGLVVRQVGRGTYVGDPDRPKPGEGLTPAEMIEFRLVVEPSVLESAACAATEHQLAEIQSIARLGRDVTHWRQAEDVDRRFHQGLFGLSRNPLFVELGERISAARDSRAWLMLKEGNFSLRRWAVFQKEHEGIVAALLERNADAAKTALRHHLAGVRDSSGTLSWQP